jgi:hypothetical protein
VAANATLFSGLFWIRAAVEVAIVPINVFLPIAALVFDTDIDMVKPHAIDESNDDAKITVAARIEFLMILAWVYTFVDRLNQFRLHLYRYDRFILACELANNNHQQMIDDEKKKVLRVALRPPEDLLQEGRSRIFEDFVSKLFCHTNDATPVFKYKLVQKHQTEVFNADVRCYDKNRR